MDKLYIMGLVVGECSGFSSHYWGEIACVNYVANEAGKALGLSACHELHISFMDGIFNACDEEGNRTEGEFDMKNFANLIEGDE